MDSCDSDSFCEFWVASDDSAGVASSTEGFCWEEGECACVADSTYVLISGQSADCLCGVFDDWGVGDGVGDGVEIHCLSEQVHDDDCACAWGSGFCAFGWVWAECVGFDVDEHWSCADANCGFCGCWEAECWDYDFVFVADSESEEGADECIGS